MAKRLPDEVAIEVGLDDADDEETLARRVARELGVSRASLPELVLLKRSLDARRGRVRFRLLFGLAQAPAAPIGGARPREVGRRDVVIVGDGPAGMFAAYQLARHGVGSIVVERGKRVQPRRRDLRGLNRFGVVDPDSNYCFGEGGAGTYSDGKLYTRAHKRGNVRDVIEILALHGAPSSILTDARPHIGSSRLPIVVTAIRERLEAAGVEHRFESRVVELLVERGAIAGVRLADGAEIAARAVILATGHSARDVFSMLERAGVRLEPKPFALGVRIEHPQPLIDRIQYGAAAGHPKLPSAAYRVACDTAGHGVFSFCMCPGGFIVPAATEPDGVVVNGMSLRRRDSPFANSGLVVSVEPRELEAHGFGGALGGVALQRALEQAAFAAGGGALVAPATRATDFVEGRGSTTVPTSSYIPGLTAGNVAEVLDAGGLPIADHLRRAIRQFDRMLSGYLTEEAVLVGVETRTSSPVRVPRDPETLVSRELRGLYPAAEGAGHAGGIVSAAVDGMRIAESVISSLGVEEMTRSDV
jgi:uncharacterized FAD-dependent dehydrogenase